MKCVPIRPFVDAPQIAKPPASNQNARVRAADAEPVDGLPRGAAGVHRRCGHLGCAIERQPDVGRVLAQEEQHEGYDGERAARDDEGR